MEWIYFINIKVRKIFLINSLQRNSAAQFQNSSDDNLPKIRLQIPYLGR